MLFRPALDVVVSALEQIREQSSITPSASKQALEALLQGVDVVGITAPEPVRSVATAVPRDAAQGSKAARLAAIQQRVAACGLCPNLASSRTQTVFGVGNPDADVM